MEVIHFGAGNIGKGFIAHVLSNNGFDVCFVDVEKNNIDTIRREGKYYIEVLTLQRQRIEVNNISILDGINEQQQIIDKIIKVDLITTSVGVNNLAKIAPLLTKALIARFIHNGSPINIIANENAINATHILKLEIAKWLPNDQSDILDKIGFVNSAIDRQAIAIKHGDTIITAVEPFWEWVINQQEMVSHRLPTIANATYVDNLRPYIEKKLYIVNLGHAALAYLGFVANKATILQTISIASFKKFVKTTMKDSAKYLGKQYAFSDHYLSDYIDNTLTRFANPHLQDSVLRVAKSPIRKLAANDRLIGPLLQLNERHLPVNNLCKVIAMALLFNDPQDLEAVTLQNFIQQHSIECAIKQYCQIQSPSLISTIKRYYSQLLPIVHGDYDSSRVAAIEHILFNP